MRGTSSAVLAVAIAAALAAPASAEAGGITFDQVQYRIAGNQPRPTAFDFETDYQRALGSAQKMAASTNATPEETKRVSRKVAALAGAAFSGQVALGMLQSSIPGFGSMIAGAAGDAFHSAMLGQLRANAGDAQGMLRNGSLSRYAFNAQGWERVESPQFNTVVIIKPELHQAIVLDTAHKTWTRRPVSDAELQSGGAALGSMLINYSLNSQVAPSLASRTIDGVATSGVTSDATVVASSASGSCSNGTARMLNTVYYANEISAPALLQAQDSVSQVVEMPGCVPRINGDVPTDHRLAVVRITDVNGGAADPSNDQGVLKVLQADREAAFGAAGFAKDGGAETATIVTERGHIRTLGAEDQSLFEIPSGYTEK